LIFHNAVTYIVVKVQSYSLTRYSVEYTLYYSQVTAECW